MIKNVKSRQEVLELSHNNGVPAGTIDPEAKAYVWEIDLANVPDRFHESLARGIVSLHQVSVEKA
jgi:macrolide phosphotransferase